MASGDGPVLVAGATGQQGGAAARALLSRGWAVHALVRDPAKPAARVLAESGARLVTGDLDDPGSPRASDCCRSRVVEGECLAEQPAVGESVHVHRPQPQPADQLGDVGHVVGEGDAGKVGGLV